MLEFLLQLTDENKDSAPQYLSIVNLDAREKGGGGTVSLTTIPK